MIHEEDNWKKELRLNITFRSLVTTTARMIISIVVMYYYFTLIKDHNIAISEIFKWVYFTLMVIYFLIPLFKTVYTKEMT